MFLSRDILLFRFDFLFNSHFLLLNLLLIEVDIYFSQYLLKLCLLIFFGHHLLLRGSWLWFFLVRRDRRHVFWQNWSLFVGSRSGLAV